MIAMEKIGIPDTTVKLLYVDNVDPETLPGVNSKVLAQVMALNTQGLKCKRFCLQVELGLAAKIKRRVPFMSDGVNWGSVPLKGCDAYYFRKPHLISREFLTLLAEIKRESPSSIILLEFPTYPYDSELRTIRSSLLLLREKYNRKKLSKYVDRAVCLCDIDEIFGIPALRAVNGIDLSVVAPRCPSTASSAGVINVICVAAFARWHGIDRFIAGLADYYRNGGERKILLHLVGDGSAIAGLKRDVVRLTMTEHVVFYGQCNRAQMDAIYDRCAIAIESLGNHRKGISLSSSLKSREYLAKGIPFVYSGEIDVFLEEPADFCLRIPANEQAVNIQSFLDYYDKLYTHDDEEELVNRIRDYAERNVSVEKGMGNVIAFLRNNAEG